MRTYTQTVQEGEYLGPVDWSYDWDQHKCVNSQCVEAGREILRQMEANPGGWRYSASGMSSFEVVHVGMYDGWPFWKPTPAIGYIGPLGSIEWAFFYSLSEHNLYREEPK